MTMDALSATMPIGAGSITAPFSTSGVDQLGGNPRTHTTDAAVPVGDSSSQTLIDREAFLKLLVAQLRYQDPSKPIDSSELISQSAQLSVVDKLSEIAGMLKSSAATEQLSMAGSIVGKEVSFYGPDGVPMTGTVSHVMFEAGEMTLGVGGWDVPFGAVIAVFDRPPAPPAGAPAPSAPAPAAPDTPAAPAPPVDATGPVDGDPDLPEPTLPAPIGTDTGADPEPPVDEIDDPNQPQETTP